MQMEMVNGELTVHAHTCLYMLLLLILLILVVVEAVIIDSSPVLIAYVYTVCSMQ